MEKLTFDNLPAAMAAMQAKQDLINNKLDRLLKQNETATAAPPELMTLEDAAKYLRKAKQTIYGLCQHRKLPFIKKSGKLYFKRAELDKWLESGTMEPIEN